jgi:hypothetical protein
VRRLLALLWAAAVAAVPGTVPAPAAVASDFAAAHAQYRLNWVEHARKSGRIVMTFRVERVDFAPRSWTARVSFRNRSTQTMRIRPEFALLVSTKRRYDPDAFRPLLAGPPRPRMPSIFFPGQSWEGTLAGPGRPSYNTFVRVNFGFFVVRGLFTDSPTGFNWITDHVFKVAEVA